VGFVAVSVNSRCSASFPKTVSKAAAALPPLSRPSLTASPEESASPTTSVDQEAALKTPGNNSYDPNLPHGGEGDGAQVDHDPLDVVCPPHTTEKKLMAKIDLRVIPFLCLLYLLAFLDRVNIGNAKIQGMTKELHMVGQDYSIALFIFFIP